VNAMQHVKLAEIYKADLVTSEGNGREHVRRRARTRGEHGQALPPR
jgi:hypothetical protein